jgi:hypothetical protein
LKRENHEIQTHTQKTKKKLDKQEQKKRTGGGKGAVISQYSSVVRRYDSKIERDGRRRQSGKTQKEKQKKKFHFQSNFCFSVLSRKVPYSL